ncbi:MAG TPA: 6-phosphogluconolactonase, partial [Bryobacteraceae bacterium]|nr:6-phosphogluconolactonase [Bryobacteraceae bacterium]
DVMRPHTEVPQVAADVPLTQALLAMTAGGMGMTAIIDAAGVPQGNIHRILAELAPEEAARRYEQTVRDFFGLKPGELPHFDVIHRGMGADAHTASLFPGEPLIGDRQGIAAAVYAQRLGQWRITLLPGVLESARNTVMLVTGADKAEVLRAVFQEPYAPERYPAQLGSRGGAMTWFLDEGVARLIAGG